MSDALPFCHQCAPYPYLRRGERRIRRRQRQLSRKQKGSKNREKARQRLAVVHERVANQRRDFPYLRRDLPYLRRDFHHQLSHDLVDRYGIIGIEDLNIQGMVRNGKLAKSISDAGWGQFLRFLRYKAEWSGGEILNVDRLFPSSKLCSECGEQHQALKLSERQWVCLSCGVLHDRDTNAAINILKATTAGAAGSPSKSRERHACGDTILVGGSAQEAHVLISTAPPVRCSRG